jgi:general L-amino acid transport system permease protein
MLSSARQRRSFMIQLLVALSVATGLLYLLHNTATNLAERGIASGFDFLSRPAGFDIAFSLIPFGEGASFARAFWVGVTNTLFVAGISMLVATAVGLAVALLRLSHNPLFKLLGGTYVEIARNIPLLLHLFFWYFAVLRNLPGPRQSLDFAGLVFLNIRGLYVPFPEERAAMIWLLLLFVLGLILGHLLRGRAVRLRVTQGRFPWWHLLPYGIPLFLPGVFLLATAGSWTFRVPELQGFNFSGGLQLIPELVALVLALGLYTAAFVGEIIRAGIQSVPKGQREAAGALGLSRFDTLRLIILPQALRVVLPPLTSQYLNVTKNSSLAAAIAFPDLVLVFAGTALNVTGQAVEIMAMTMLVYLVISLSISYLIHCFQMRVLRYDM